jgi:hypothetical protein
MATKHYVCDYEIVKKDKVVKSGTLQFARVNVADEHDEEEAFEAIRPQYENGGLRLKQETFREVVAVGKVPTDEAGNIIDRPTVIVPPAPLVVPGGLQQ